MRLLLNIDHSALCCILGILAVSYGLWALSALKYILWLKFVTLRWKSDWIGSKFTTHIIINAKYEIKWTKLFGFQAGKYSITMFEKMWSFQSTVSIWETFEQINQNQHIKFIHIKNENWLISIELIAFIFWCLKL